MAEVNGQIFKKPKTQHKVKINPYTGNYHLCQSRSAAISRNIELMDLTGDKYTKRFTGLMPNRLSASTTTPNTLADPSQSPDANNNIKENLIMTQTATVEIGTTTKHEEKMESKKSSLKRCKKSKGTSSKRPKRSSDCEYRKKLEQLF